MATIHNFVSKQDQKHRLAVGKTLLLMLFALLAACSPAAKSQNTADLPTLAQLPTLTSTKPLPTTAPSAVQPSAVPMETATVTDTLTPTLTVTPSATITDTPTPTYTATLPPTETPIPTADNEGLVELALLAAQATVLPQSALPAAVPTTVGGVVVLTPATTSCVYPPPGGFGTLFLNNPALIQQIGCPVGTPPVTASMPSAAQVYEHGEMMWLQGPPAAIYALFSTGRFQRYDDTFNAATDPASGGETPPSGLKEPVRGFGKVWRTFPEVRSGLGWANADESGGQATVQVFERGQMIYLPQRGMIYTFIYDANSLSGTWQAVAGSF